MEPCALQRETHTHTHTQRGGGGGEGERGKERGRKEEKEGEREKGRITDYTTENLFLLIPSMISEAEPRQ